LQPLESKGLCVDAPSVRKVLPLRYRLLVDAASGLVEVGDGQVFEDRPAVEWIARQPARWRGVRCSQRECLKVRLQTRTRARSLRM
jgi:hypothetical protein